MSSWVAEVVRVEVGMDEGGDDGWCAEARTSWVANMVMETEKMAKVLWCWSSG